MIPSWTKSCANPLLPYPSSTDPNNSHPMYPGYPGKYISDITAWQTSCLGPKQYGNCAFQQYAQNPGKAITGFNCGPDIGTTDLLESALHRMDKKPSSVCFANRKDSSDLLCIFQEFEIGNVNAEQMKPESRASNLAALILGANAQEGGLANKRFCLHRGEWASVGWTHLHTFDASKSAWPDGLSDSNAYCSTWKGSAEDTAKALDDMINVRQNGCERIDSACCTDMGSTAYCREQGLHCDQESMKCKDNQDPAICKYNSGCVAKGLSGDNFCCPTATGVKLACC
jgi:hypothetical protein